MKLMIASVLLLGAGAGGFELAADRAEGACEPCPYEGGRVEMKCLDDGTCLVTCYDDAGDVVCQGEIECKAPCDTPCDTECGAVERCAR